MIYLKSQGLLGDKDDGNDDYFKFNPCPAELGYTLPLQTV